MVATRFVRSMSIVLTVLTRSEPAWGQAPSTFGRIQENRVELLDIGTGSWRAIYRTSKPAVSDLGVAPGGNRLAVLAWSRGEVSGQGYSVQPATELVVIDTLGRTLVSVPHVHRYAWCGGDCLAYIVGSYSEDSDIGFRPESVGLLDIASGKRVPIAGPRWPVSVTWNPLDSAVYIRAIETGIHRLDLVTLKLTPTTLHDHQFSPSGRYYLSRPPMTDSVTLYRTRSNAPVDLSTLLRGADLVGWAGPSGDLLLAVRHVPRPPRKPGDPPPRPRPIKPSDIRPLCYFLYRVSDGRVVGEAKGFLHRWDGPAQTRLVRQGDKYRVLK